MAQTSGPVDVLKNETKRGGRGIGKDREMVDEDGDASESTRFNVPGGVSV